VVGADDNTVSQKDGTEFLEAENDSEQLLLGDGVEHFWTTQDLTRESKDSVLTIIQELIDSMPRATPEPSVWRKKVLEKSGKCNNNNKIKRYK
jgi:hypothetical protein